MTKNDVCHVGFHVDSNPSGWDGDRWWVAALVGATQTQGTKSAGLTRIILDELLSDRVPV